MFEIIKNAELPEKKRSGAGRQRIYPFPNMEVGDGFDAPRDMGKSKLGSDLRYVSISAGTRTYAKRYNPTAKFTTRILDENTIRCVRIA